MTNLTDLQERGVNGVAFDLEPLAVELDAYGEHEIATKLRKVNPETHAKISEAALSKMVSLGLTTDKAICLAAVEILEGEPRDLRRKRRVYSK